MLGSFHYYGSSLVLPSAPFSTHPRILNLKGLLWTQFTCGWMLSGAGTLAGVKFQRCTSRLLDLSELQFPGRFSDFYSTGSWEYLKDIVSVQGPALGEHSLNLWPHREPGAKSFIVDQLLLRSMQQSSHHAVSFEIKEPLVTFSIHRTCWGKKYFLKKFFIRRGKSRKH